MIIWKNVQQIVDNLQNLTRRNPIKISNNLVKIAIISKN